MLTYSSQKARNIAEEKIPFNLEGPTGCGELDIDIRVTTVKRRLSTP